MVILLEMTVGTVLWVLVLFAATIFAYNLTCTDLSWESNAKRAALTLRNAGNVRKRAVFVCITSFTSFYSIS